ncbi:MAG: hypothetical protein H6R14_772 [Proteobacteria bacterium]|nr:hypothetical protein [Pseudomonadota bacterium]
MSMESDLVALLTPICGETYPDVAPLGVAMPYVVWQQLGGETMRYADNTAMDHRRPLVQVAVWSEARQTSLDLIRQIEDALTASSAFTAEPQGEPISMYEPDTQRYGSIQRFLIWAAR